MEFSDYLNHFFVLDVHDKEINEAKILIKSAIYTSDPIYIMGNGGSAYTANHFSQDLVKICDANSISLSENIGLIMAVANDISYDDVFRFQLENKIFSGGENGVVIAISCSGNSKNIIKAVEYCDYASDMPIISFTGNDGGMLAKLSDVNINIPTENIFESESYHSLICHFLVQMLSEEL